MADQQQETLSEFINAPTTVDFIAANSDLILNYIKHSAYLESSATLSGGYVIVHVDEQDIDKVLSELGSDFYTTESIVLGLLDEPTLSTSGISQVHNLPALSLKGSGVIVGIVDTGIEYTNPAFMHKDGTSKIISIYDQTITGTTPYNLGIGVEYTQDQINQALASNNPLLLVPEKDTVGHGTFLASVAAGSEIGDFKGAAPEADLIVVKLRKARSYYLRKYLVPADQENAYESSDIMIGVEYIVKKAQELGRPAAICIGLGTNLGGHDGSSLFENYLDVVGRIPGFCLCLAAGNESEARHHHMGALYPNSVEDVKLNVGPNAGDIYISIWNSPSDLLSVSLTSPAGEIMSRVAPDLMRAEYKFLFEKTRAIIEYNYPINNSGAQNTVIKLLQPTPGIWTITVYGNIVTASTYHIWLPITGFVSPNVAFVTPNPYYTVVVPSTALNPIRCGGYDTNQKKIYNQTSYGPNRLEVLAPDLVAPCVDVGGIYPQGPGTMTGTSVAAAITTGAAALMLEWGIIANKDIAMGTNKIRAYFIRGATRVPGISYPNFSWGYGLLNLLNAFTLMR